MPFHLPESISCQQFSSETPRVLSLCIAGFHTDGHRCVRLTRWHFLAFSIPSSSYVLSAPSSTKFLNFKEVVCLFLPTNSAYHYVEIKSFDQNLAVRKKILFWTYNSYRAEISSSHLIWFHVFRHTRKTSPIFQIVKVMRQTGHIALGTIQGERLFPGPGSMAPSGASSGS